LGSRSLDIIAQESVGVLMSQQIIDFQRELLRLSRDIRVQFENYAQKKYELSRAEAIYELKYHATLSINRKDMTADMAKATTLQNEIVTTAQKDLLAAMKAYEEAKADLEASKIEIEAIRTAAMVEQSLLKLQ